MKMNYPIKEEYAEVVFPGHPDKLADAIADSIVGKVYAEDTHALVGIEVAVSLSCVLITGRIAAGPKVVRSIDIEGIVRQVYHQAGYGGIWSPDPGELTIDTSGLILEVILKQEREIRHLSDDQSITVGYAVNSPETNFLPRAQWLAWNLMYTIMHLKNKTEFGPDGKLMCYVVNHEEIGRLERIVVSLQHSPEIDWSRLNVLVWDSLKMLKDNLACKGKVIEIDMDSIDLIVNGHGDFSTGGPYGDNGLSGKKLVMDAYGPSVPIGGGAYSGKDPHKVDRLGPLLAREMALEAVLREGLSEERVSITWAPGRSGYITCDFLNCSQSISDLIKRRLPRDIEGIRSRYFPDGKNPKLSEFAKFGWYSGKFDATWERIINK